MVLVDGFVSYLNHTNLELTVDKACRWVCSSVVYNDVYSKKINSAVVW